MHLDNLLSLTQGVLWGEPTVSHFGSYHIETKRVRRSGVWIAFEPEKFREAIENGAYAVIHTDALTPNDPEIAWISVDNLDEALLRIARFELLQSDLKAYATDSLGLELAKTVALPAQPLLILDQPLRTHFEHLLHIEPHTLILFHRDLIDPALFTSNIHTIEPYVGEFRVTEQTLFECAWFMDGNFYERGRISPLFIPDLLAIIQLFKREQISIKTHFFDYISHFEPLFVNRALHVKPFGQSQQVVIFEPDIAFAQREITFIDTQAPWAKRLYLLPPICDHFETLEGTIVNYKSCADIIELLKAVRFDYALVVGCSGALLKERYEQHPRPTLF